jgi:aldehyde dehydrogenase (NAD+)
MADDARRENNYIDGEWRPAASGSTRPNVNPSDVADVIGNFADSDGVDTVEAVSAAAAAAGAWQDLGPVRRGEVLERAGAIMRTRAEELAAAVTREQGKLLREARAEVSRALSILAFTAGEGRRLNGATTPAEEARTFSFTFRTPIGVVGLITPWNFPLAIPLWKVAPALLSGCTAILKPSPFTPLTAAMLVEVFADAGVPRGVLNLVQGDRMPGEELVRDERVAGISFTGSLAVGTAIHVAGAARLLRTQLELGGKNALIVLHDADLDAAARAVVLGAFGQAGQRCSATSRLVVDRRVRDALVERIAAVVAAYTVGPGADPASDIGPVVNGQRLDACLEAVSAATASGASAVLGGTRITEGLPRGYYMQPSILVDVEPDAAIAQEEVFGPVLSVIDVDGFDEAVHVANGVRYGMAAAVFTRDQSLAFEALARLEAGMLHVNRPGVGSYSHMPHGGVKASAFGPPEIAPQVWDFYTDWKSACITY